MGICWYCYWGWAAPVCDVYEKALAKLGGFSDPLHYGPAHVVWDDENFGDDTIKCCLTEYFGDKYSYDAEQLAVVRESLEQLLAIPEDVRCCEPDDYDAHPERYPPRTLVRHAKRNR